MTACRVCTANGHEAIKLVGGEYICPLKIRDDKAKIGQLERLIHKAAVVLGEVDDGIVDGSLIDEGPLEYICDNVRPLVCDLLGHKPRCHNTQECRQKLSRRPKSPIK